MKTLFYHESFEYNENYNFENSGTNGILLDAKRIVCPTCNGTGSHFRNDLDENLMLDDIREDGDYDSMEAYQGGAFDQVCTECNGNNVIIEPTWEFAPRWINKAIQSWEDDKRQDEQIRFAENGYR